MPPVSIVACVVSSLIRAGIVAVVTFNGKLMLSFVAEGACATTSVFGADCVPPGKGVVTEIAREPAAAMSEAGIEANN
jgi:hypothetical protein